MGWAYIMGRVGRKGRRMETGKEGKREGRRKGRERQ